MDLFIVLVSLIIIKVEPLLKLLRKSITILGITAVHFQLVRRKKELLELSCFNDLKYHLFLLFSHRLDSTTTQIK